MSRTDLRYCMEWAEHLARSGLYNGANADELLPRVAMGAAIGIDPATAAANISVAKGKATLSAALQSALLVRRGEVFYEIAEESEEAVTLEWKPGPNWRHGERKLGRSRFTIQEAQRAGLLEKKGSPWHSYPTDLLFARALTRGIKRYAPDLLAGTPACTPEEVGQDVDRGVGQPWQRVAAPATVAASPPAWTPAATPTVPAPEEEPAARPQLDEARIAELRRLKAELNIDSGDWRHIVAKRNVESAYDLSPSQADELIGKLSHMLAAKSLEEGFHSRGESQPSAELTVAVPLGAKREKEAEAASSPNGFLFSQPN